MGRRRSQGLGGGREGQDHPGGLRGGSPWTGHGSQRVRSGGGEPMSVQVPGLTRAWTSTDTVAAECQRSPKYTARLLRTFVLRGLVERAVDGDGNEMWRLS